MRKQAGFTLIELMVVMAIIAILATAGLSAYTGYLRKARDATRLEDMRALENVAISGFNASGQALDHDGFIAAVSAMNNGVVLKDPMDTQEICINNGGFIGYECLYEYFKCSNGGYVLKVRFESLSNKPLYTQDKLNIGSGASDTDVYDIGNCDSVMALDFGPPNLNAIR